MEEKHDGQLRHWPGKFKCL